jgi:hypothetical protein
MGEGWQNTRRRAAQDRAGGLDGRSMAEDWARGGAGPVWSEVWRSFVSSYSQRRGGVEGGAKFPRVVGSPSCI